MHLPKQNKEFFSDLDLSLLDKVNTYSTDCVAGYLFTRRPKMRKLEYSSLRNDFRECDYETLYMRNHANA